MGEDVTLDSAFHKFARRGGRSTHSHDPAFWSPYLYAQGCACEESFYGLRLSLI